LLFVNGCECKSPVSTAKGYLRLFNVGSKNWIPAILFEWAYVERRMYFGLMARFRERFEVIWKAHERLEEEYWFELCMYKYPVRTAQ
jgi:hypothetical protein